MTQYRKKLNFNGAISSFFCLGKKFLVYNLISRNLKNKYRRSVFGIVWTLLSPLSLATVYYVAFKIFLKVQVPHYLTFILSGIFIWNFFAQTVSEAMITIVNNYVLVSKSNIPVQVFPFVANLTNLVTLCTSIPIVLLSTHFSNATLGWSLVLLPLYLVCLFLLTYSISLMLAISYVYFRDLKHAIGIVLSIWQYSSPIVYSENSIPSHFQWLLYVNPLGYLFVGVHQIMVDGRWPHPTGLSVLLIWTALLTCFAIGFQMKVSRNVVEMI